MSASTIVLRYYDFDYETIKEHTKLIEDRGFVWWAWWKKRQEPWQRAVLEEVASRCPVEIGLVNRVAKEYYSAKCEQVVFEESGDLIASPDIEFTPNYYKHSTHPAWFKISGIFNVTSQEFATRFGGTPKGEATLFVVQRQGTQVTLLDESLPELQNTETPGDSILHLSDIHFGEDHGYPAVAQNTGIAHRPLAQVIESITNSLSGLRIGIVVISGDLLTKGAPEGFVVAQNFLSDLLSRLKLGKEHVVVVPGNHDISITDFQTAPYRYAPEDPYRNFLRSFFGNSSRIERLQHFRTPGGWKFNFLSLNSSSIRKKDFMDYGFVGRDKYEPFLTTLKEANEQKGAPVLAADKVLNFVVLHHHIVPVQDVDLPEPERPISVMLDAGQLVTQFQNASIHFVLHGHQHVPFIGRTARVRRVEGEWMRWEQPITVLGSGSSGAKVGRLFDVIRNNTLSFYTPDNDQMRITIQQFNPGIDGETYIDLKLPLTSND